MPRKPGMALGPGAAAGGGLGKKPQPPKTVAAGKPPLSAPAGLPPPMPGGLGGPPGRPPPGAGGGGGMGGAPGFRKGGVVKSEMKGGNRIEKRSLREGSRAEEARDRREDKKR